MMKKAKGHMKASNDAYLIFKKMLINGNPPTDWKVLLKQSENYAKKLLELSEK